MADLPIECEILTDYGKLPEASKVIHSFGQSTERYQQIVRDCTREDNAFGFELKECISSKLSWCNDTPSENFIITATQDNKIVGVAVLRTFTESREGRRFRTDKQLNTRPTLQRGYDDKDVVKYKSELLRWGVDCVALERDRSANWAMYLAIPRDKPFYIITKFGVLPHLQSHGHGRKLMEYVQEFADSGGRELVYVTAHGDGVEFFKKCGFPAPDETHGEGQEPNMYALRRPEGGF